MSNDDAMIEANYYQERLTGQEVTERVAARLGVQWNIECIYSEETNGPEIEVDRQQRIHRIFFPAAVEGHENKYIGDFAHECGHALLAEKYDTIFGTPFANPDNNLARNDLDSELAHGMHAIVDTWVSEAVYEIQPQWVTGMLRDSLEGCLETSPEEYFSMGQYGPLGYALALADCDRRQLRQFQPACQEIEMMIRQVYGDDEWQLMKRLKNVFRRAPRLKPGDWKGSLDALETQGQKVLRLLQAPILPTIARDAQGHNSYYEIET